ncbi:MAG: peptidoglycan DD-metalloendopeptidase family protein [Patescibacteria group bacterium]
MSYQKVNAWSLPSFLGTDALASDSTDSSQVDKNLQTMTLLQSNISPTAIIQDKKDKDNNSIKKDDSSDGVIQEDASVNISSENALVPASTGHIIDDNMDTEDSYSNQTSIYVVKKGDSIAQIADMFGVSVNTILWANDMKKGDKLTEGDILVILPVSGVKHTVTKGETLKSIAKFYKADISDIESFNGITEGTKLSLGDELIIPDGEVVDKTPVKSTNKKGKIPLYVETNIGSIFGYFIKPIPCPLTQGKHDHYAVDMSCHEIGTPIKAAADGVVIFARDHAYNGGFGYLTIVKHSNGTETFYAHQSKILVSKGDFVKQGEVIGKVGSTGHSTGPHLHFEVRGATNPGFDKTGSSWKLQ